MPNLVNMWIFISNRWILYNNILFKILTSGLLTVKWFPVRTAQSQHPDVYKHYKSPLNGMPIDVIRWESHTLSLKPFAFFSQLQSCFIKRYKKERSIKLRPLRINNGISFETLNLLHVSKCERRIDQQDTRVEQRKNLIYQKEIEPIPFRAPGRRSIHLATRTYGEQGHLTGLIHRFHKWRTHGKKLVPSHENEAF